MDSTDAMPRDSYVKLIQTKHGEYVMRAQLMCVMYIKGLWNSISSFRIVFEWQKVTVLHGLAANLFALWCFFHLLAAWRAQDSCVSFLTLPLYGFFELYFTTAVISGCCRSFAAARRRCQKKKQKKKKTFIMWLVIRIIEINRYLPCLLVLHFPYSSGVMSPSFNTTIVGSSSSLASSSSLSPEGLCGISFFVSAGWYFEE